MREIWVLNEELSCEFFCFVLFFFFKFFGMVLSCEFGHIRREGNELADASAKDRVNRNAMKIEFSRGKVTGFYHPFRGKREGLLRSNNIFFLIPLFLVCTFFDFDKSWSVN